MSTRLKIRCVSEQDFGSTVKQMIDGALEDTEQLTKLERAIYEEWYFKKMDEIRETKNQVEQYKKELKNDSPDCVACHENQSNTNSSVHWKPSVIDNEVHELEELNTQKCISKNLNDFPTSNQAEQLSELSHDEYLRDIQKEEDSEAIAAPVVHTIRRIKPNKRITKIVRLSNTSDTDVHDNVSENYLVLRLKDCVRTSTNLTASHSTVRTLNEPLVEINEEKKKELATSENSQIQESPELIEVWRGQMNVKNETANDQKLKTDKSKKKRTNRTAVGEAAFEIWKRAKNARYSRIFKEEQKMKQLERVEKLNEEERKRNAYETCRRVRKQRDEQRKLNSLKKRVMQEVKEAAQRELHAKEIANAQAFKSWKRQKDDESKKRRMMTYNQQYYQQQTQMTRQIQGFDTFNLWLNQLDCVLHQKYLRERRHLVRSFYCQPVYYGSTAIST
ncbi:stress response protein NST1-like [Cephus cinctus]|uniref:Stress response protein NST1-like n=1 Tax=Cephus cinctus TaxID=211228 RepID=A0AAJ7VYV5_CEPCN|nr:stress response protein NST1-like [Cephus cinctus]